LDTRTKIVGLDVAIDAARRAPASVVTGYFDPVLAAHARRLREIRGGRACLIVLLAEPDQPLLDAKARAELLAALAAVDHVVLPGDWASLEPFQAMPGCSIFHEESADRARFESLVDHVHRRQQEPVAH
jgi:hypothetical protein